MNCLISGCAPGLYPAEQLFGLLHCTDGSSIEIPLRYPLCGEWGQSEHCVFRESSNKEIPNYIDLVYLSVVERRFYSIQSSIPFQRLTEALGMNLCNSEIEEKPTIVIGMAPHGLVVIWVIYSVKSVVVSTYIAEPIEVPMKFFRSSAPHTTIDEVCQRYINDHHDVKINLETHGLPEKCLFDNYMKQFTYRYLYLFEHWDKDKEEWQKYNDEEMIPELDYIEEALFDGTHDKLHDGGLMNYHQAGKPKKLAVKWHVKKKEWTAYFWFEDEAIREVFDNFYGAHPDTKTDFMIRIDAEKNKYELALYRYGLKEPKVIKESAYQLLVFKNKFECFRSKNYNQPRGAWIW